MAKQLFAVKLQDTLTLYVPLVENPHFACVEKIMVQGGQDWKAECCLVARIAGASLPLVVAADMERRCSELLDELPQAPLGTVVQHLEHLLPHLDSPQLDLLVTSETARGEYSALTPAQIIEIIHSFIKEM